MKLLVKILGYTFISTPFIFVIFGTLYAYGFETGLWILGCITLMIGLPLLGAKLLNF